MEQLISEVEVFASLTGISPQKVLRDAIGASWGTWEGWSAGVSSPTMKVVDRLRAHMLAKQKIVADCDPKEGRDAA